MSEMKLTQREYQIYLDGHHDGVDSLKDYINRLEIRVATLHEALVISELDKFKEEQEMLTRLADRETHV